MLSETAAKVCSSFVVDNIEKRSSDFHLKNQSP